MRHLYKKISLEPFKTRIPNTLPSFKDGEVLYPSNVSFFYEHPNGVFNSLPSDIQIPDEIDDEDLKEYWNLNNIIDRTSMFINLHDEYYDDNLSIIYRFRKLSQKNYDGNWIEYPTAYKSTEKHMYLSYRKLHKWYRFFKDYFKLLASTTCNKDGNSYNCAVDYYYNNNVDNETLEYYKELDELFISRGGIINDEKNGTFCPLYEWMKRYIFMSFEIPKKLQKEWKYNELNINTLFEWYSWFKIRYIKYKECNDDISKCINSDDCCDCKEYIRLGGNEMYELLDSYVKSYYEKANKIQSLSTFSATINVPIQLQTSANSIGEFSPLVEEWEGGVDYSTDKEHGTAVHYGGTTFYDTESNDMITIEDSVFISNKEKGYIQNKFKELTFLDNGKTIYEEYLPTYINNSKEYHDDKFKIGRCYECKYDGTLKENNGVWICPECGAVVIDIYDTVLNKQGIPNEFSKIKDNGEDVSTYTYFNGKYIANPDDNRTKVSVEYDIITPEDGLHFYYINGEIYSSITANTVTIDKLHNIKLIVKYLDDDKENTPYIEYMGGKYYGYYVEEINNKHYFKFTLSKKICQNSEWFYLDTDDDGNIEINEYVIYKGKYYSVNKNDSTIEINKTFLMKYRPFYGYFTYRNGTLINKIDGEYYLSFPSEDIEDFDGEYECVSEINGINNELFGKKIDDIDNWKNDVRGYYFDDNENPSKIYYILPYNIYDINYVTGKTASKIDILTDVIRFNDKLGNEMNGKYCGSNFFPSDEDILDIYYHIGNINEEEHILRESGDTSDIVYGSVTANGLDYYWGNIISNITFYYLDNNGMKVYDEYENKLMEVSPTKVFKTKNDCLKSFSENLTAIEELEEWGDEYFKKKSEELETELTNTFKLCCNIQYNIGAIIKRPYSQEGDKFIYGQYQLCDEYHKGVEYSEDYEIKKDYQIYFLEKVSFYKVAFYSLNVMNKMTYYLDDIVTKDSEPYTASEATYKVEINSDLTETSNNKNTKKFTSELNSNYSDGRQFNFYNGLMASPNYMEEYNIGITSLRNIKDNIYLNRGVNYAFDRHLKLLEVKTLEALEQYNNGFFNIKNLTEEK